ncbi:hypothetical protein SBOR_8282 [Sclerotinia borealis F-4128]|uniref:Uncharacterized protein n=1 Tax=Sclerotinia borealis (strain F-4128) TaxID=1432307 RepID=W9C679_SCLBF|nr:hypothetical protein SBOR_8282 [Sclerotinia borealis F-4128]
MAGGTTHTLSGFLRVTDKCSKCGWKHADHRDNEIEEKEKHAVAKRAEHEKRLKAEAAVVKAAREADAAKKAVASKAAREAAAAKEGNGKVDNEDKDDDNVKK